MDDQSKPNRPGPDASPTPAAAIGGTCPISASTSAPRETLLPRRHEIDALRSIALFLLILYHAFIAYQPFAPKIYFIEYSASLEHAWWLGELMNTWRIPVLFLISGITAGYLLQNRGVGTLLSARLMRLVPPLVVATLFISPFSPLIHQLYTGGEPFYFTHPEHLWFVWNLVVYLVLAAPLLVYLRRHPDGVVVRTLRAAPPVLWLLLLPPGLFVTGLVLEPHISAELFSVHYMRFWNGFACFGAGLALVAMGDRFWNGIRWVCHVALPIALVLYTVRMLGPEGVLGVLGVELDPDRVAGPGVRESAAIFARTVESVCGMLAFLGYGSLVFTRPSRVVSVLNRAIFAVYIVHLPVQQVLAAVMFPIEMNPWLMFALHFGATLGGSVLIYVLVLRPIRWLHPLFGIPPIKTTPVATNAAVQPADERATTTPSSPTGPRRATPEPKKGWRIVVLYVMTPTVVGISLLTQGVTLLGVYMAGINQADDPPAIAEAVERFRHESADRSAEQNRAEAARLRDSMREAWERGDLSRAEILRVEIEVIEDALAAGASLGRSPSQADAPVDDPINGPAAGPDTDRAP